MSNELLQSYSPQAPADLVGEFRRATPAETADVLAAARSVQRDWFALGAAGRAAALRDAAIGLRAARDQAVALVVREVGKPVAEATGEVARAISILEYYAQACFAAIGSQYPPSLGGLLFSQRRPIGVAALITPWNFPLAIPLWKSAPALAAGNSVVLKPSPYAPACAELLAKIFSDLPAGVFTVVHGGADTGAALIDGGDVVSFTGSDRVGRSVAARAGERGIPAQCEMGGQNAAIVFDDADLELSAASIAAAAMGYAGQKCTATRRVIIVGSNEDFVEALIAAVRGLGPGAPEAPSTAVGPVISQDARDRILEAVELGRSAGGEVLVGGFPVAGDGWFVEPTVIDGLASDHPLALQETFGPLLTIHRAPTAQAAAEIANRVRYGLVASVHGNDMTRLLRAAEQLDCGLVKINAPSTGVDFYAPFGGEKDSSFGPREQGLEALSFYSSSRTITIAA